MAIISITDDVITVDYKINNDDVIIDETYLKYQNAVDEFDSIQRQILEIGVSRYQTHEGYYIVRKNRNNKCIVAMKSNQSRTISYEILMKSIEHYRRRLAEDKFIKQKLLSIQAKINSVINDDDYTFFIRYHDVLNNGGSYG